MRVVRIKKETILLFLLISIIIVSGYQTYRQDLLHDVFMPTAKKVVIIDAGHGGWDPWR